MAAALPVTEGARHVPTSCRNLPLGQALTRTDFANTPVLLAVYHPAKLIQRGMVPLLIRVLVRGVTIQKMEVQLVSNVERARTPNTQKVRVNQPAIPSVGPALA